MILRILINGGDREKFLPIASTRPVAEIRAGAFTFRERLQILFPDSKISVEAPRQVAEAYTSRTGGLANTLPPGEDPILIVKPNFVFGPSFKRIVESAKPGSVFLSNGIAMAAYGVFDDVPQKFAFPGFTEIDIHIDEIPAIWDLVNLNGGIIESDFSQFFEASIDGAVHPAAMIYKPDALSIEQGAEVCAGAVLDARTGPIIVRSGTVVRPGAVIEGPCYIGPDCRIVSGWIRPACSFGPGCRVGGEIESSIFQAYSNKYHEGFVGHSYIGEWVNLGALTTTSDLKNNYGEIRVDFGSGQISTGRIKVGSFIGDHSKTGIGTILNSGTYFGVSVNHYGTGLPPKHVPDFSWGGADGYVEYDIEKALATAKTVMSRRGLEMLREEEDLFRHIHALER